MFEDDSDILINPYRKMFNDLEDDIFLYKGHEKVNFVF